jgi:subtilisin family serine protease
MSILLIISTLSVAATPVIAKNPTVEVIIGFTNQNQVSRAVINSGGSVIKTFNLIPAMLTRIPENAIQGIQRNPYVRYVEPNYQVFAHAQTTPWGIDRVFGSETYPFETWGSSTGEGVSVAVLDSGIDNDHEDLNVVNGYNAIDPTQSWDDDFWHGTHVAGTIAAMDNSYGVVGVAPDVDLYAVKVLDGSGVGTIYNVADGIEWASLGPDGISGTGDEVDIISMSLGGPAPSITVEEACDAAYSSGCLIVASAGNDGNPPGRGDNVGYPAGYESVIAIAATDQNDRRAKFSSTGLAVEISAPGVDIISTYPGAYAIAGGTSMACPHVSGVAALVWAANPELTNMEVRETLQQTAEDLGLPTYHQGHGLVRADAAVDLAQPTLPPAVGSIQGTVTDGTNPIIGATVEVEGTTISDTTDTSGNYLLVNVPVGSQAVTATAEGYVSQTLEVTVNEDLTSTLNFVLTALQTYTLTMSEPDGLGTVSPDIGSYSYTEGTLVGLAATPDANWEFDQWTVNGEPYSTSAIISLTMDSDKTVQAFFSEITVPEGTVVVDSIDYGTTGGKNNNRHLLITVTIIDDVGAGVSGAEVSIDLKLDEELVFSATQLSDTYGTVTFRYNNAPYGIYITEIIDVSAQGLTWDGFTPDNSYDHQ